MKGKPGDGAIFTDREGNEWKAILTDKTMNGNASLIYAESDEDEFTEESMNIAYNIPTEDNAIGDGPYYEHRPDAEWPNDIL